ncbi:hypothetical protein HanPI659440_Chr09g0320761 [Helianthus annuus]|nr:hypothetical protein HanPI659440_Chr12g0458061 [Helianthus annuus]KAJ0752124.1 hypothetical protein HanPI659440_Chr09g0320761 [Helianthus annuus]
MLIISIAQMMMSSAAGVGAEGLVGEIGRYRNCDQAAVSSYWGDLTEWTWNCLLLIVRSRILACLMEIECGFFPCYVF